MTRVEFGNRNLCCCCGMLVASEASGLCWWCARYCTLLLVRGKPRKTVEASEVFDG